MSMTDESREYKRDLVTASYINAHNRTKCSRDSKPWYIKAEITNRRILGICTKCGKVVEEYISWKNRDGSFV